MHSWQYDQGFGIKWTKFSYKDEKIFSVAGSVVNGDGGFGMTDTKTNLFHNSYASYTFAGELRPSVLFGLNPGFRETFGDFGIEFSYAEIDRGSNPGAKRYGNHWLVGMLWEKLLFGKEFEARVSKGELIRGLTEQGKEVTAGWVFEAAIRRFDFAGGSLTPYGYYSTFDYVSGPKSELWSVNTSYQDQWCFGLRWDNPFGLDYVYFSGGIVFRDMDGWSDWPILDNDELYFFNAVIYLK